MFRPALPGWGGCLQLQAAGMSGLSRQSTLTEFRSESAVSIGVHRVTCTSRGMFTYQVP